MLDSEIPLTAHDAIISGDTLTNLTINSQWRKFISQAIASFMFSGASGFTELEQDAFNPLLYAFFDDFYSPDDTLVTERIEARRLTTQAIAANTDTAIIWDAGDFDAANPTRLIMPVSGLVVVSANFRLVAGANTVPSVWMRANGLSQTDIANERSDAAILTHLFNETWTFELVAGQYLECWINTGVQGATLQSTGPTPRFAAAIIGSG